MLSQQCSDSQADYKISLDEQNDNMDRRNPSSVNLDNKSDESIEEHDIMNKQDINNAKRISELSGNTKDSFSPESNVKEFNNDNSGSDSEVIEINASGPEVINMTTTADKENDYGSYNKNPFSFNKVEPILQFC